MADPAPVGSDVSAGTYECANCGYELSIQLSSPYRPARSARALIPGRRSQGATAVKTRIQATKAESVR